MSAPLWRPVGGFPAITLGTVVEDPTSEVHMSAFGLVVTIVVLVAIAVAIAVFERPRARQIERDAAEAGRQQRRDQERS